MKTRYLIIIFVLAVTLSSSLSVRADFPENNIKLIVYTKTGGALDIFARRFSSIAARYTDAYIEVVNRPGGGGFTALKEILASDADGYKVMAVTKSNIGKIVSMGGEIDTDQFTWLAMMVSDPEAVIVNAGSDINTWEHLLADAREQKGEQVWVGPARGGSDHIVAMKIWDATGVRATWIPYSSGGKALAALLDNHAAAYVGNPQDILGKDDLKLAVISSHERLAGRFADVPTFREKGIVGLDNEIMWRGFMVRKGSPKATIKFYLDLFKKVHKDPEWQAFIREGGAKPVLYGEEEFTRIVNEDKAIFSITLRELNVLR